MDIQRTVEEFNARRERTSIEEARREKNVLRIVLAGELDLPGSAHLGPALEIMMDTLESGDRIVLDLSGIRYISSTGVGVLTSALMRAKRKEIRLGLERLQPKVEGIFRLLGVLEFFDKGDRHA